jgi:hypothetical protein
MKDENKKHELIDSYGVKLVDVLIELYKDAHQAGFSADEIVSMGDLAISFAQPNFEAYIDEQQQEEEYEKQMSPREKLWNELKALRKRTQEADEMTQEEIDAYQLLEDKYYSAFAFSDEKTATLAARDQANSRQCRMYSACGKTADGLTIWGVRDYDDYDTYNAINPDGTETGGLPDFKPPTMNTRKAIDIALALIGDRIDDIGDMAEDDRTADDTARFDELMEVSKVLQAILAQKGCEHFDASVRDGRLTSLMDVIIFG